MANGSWGTLDVRTVRTHRSSWNFPHRIDSTSNNLQRGRRWWVGQLLGEPLLRFCWWARRECGIRDCPKASVVFEATVL
jgi:hypothetical protein